jgi:hypothetical protein
MKNWHLNRFKWINRLRKYDNPVVFSLANRHKSIVWQGVFAGNLIAILTN